MSSLSTNKFYLELKTYFEKIGKELRLQELFSNDPKRFEKFNRLINTPDGDILVDFSKNLITEDVFKKLIELVRFFGANAF